MAKLRFSGLIVAAAMVACGCQSTTATPSGASPGGSGATPTVGVTPTPGPTGTPIPAHWSDAGSLPAAYSNWAQTHVLLVAGGKVLVVGDDNAWAPGPPSATDAAIWDPATSTWSATASLNAPREYLAAQSLLDGRAVVFGGLNDNYQSYSSTKIYAPATGTWSASGLMNTARANLGSTRLKDGRVMAIGGEFQDDPAYSLLSSVEIWDPGTGNWTLTGPLHSARRNVGAVTLTDGRVLAVGGDNGSQTVATTELWDPATGTWTVIGPLSTARQDLTLVALPGGSALVAGGLDATSLAAVSSAERLDVATLTWKPAGTMHSAAASRISAVLANGKVLVAGGRIGKWKPAISAAELYDPSAGTWTATAAIPVTLERSGTVLLSDGSVFVAGGDGGFVGPGRVPWTPDARLLSHRYYPDQP